MFNLLEIVGNNNIQVRNRISYKFDDGSEALSQYHRYVINSADDLSKEPELVKLIAEAFPFIEEVNDSDGVHKDIAFIRIMADNQNQFRYDALVYAVKDGVIIASERKRPQIVTLKLTEKDKTSNKKLADKEKKLKAKLKAVDPESDPDSKLRLSIESDIASLDKPSEVSTLASLPDKVKKVAELLLTINM